MMKYFLVLFSLLFAHNSFANSPQRVITIGGAITEIIYALEAQDRLVGSDTTSYYPKEADKLPKVGYQRALSAEGILSLNPNLIILTNEAGPDKVLNQLKMVGTKILVLKAARNVDDVKDNIAKIGKILNKENKAKEIISEIEVNYYKLQNLISNNEKPKRVMFILQHGGGAPLVAGNNTAANSIITLSGAFNVAKSYEGYKPLTPEASVALSPDIILITNQGLEEVGGKESLLNIPALSLTPAGKKGNVIAMDSLLMLGFSPRIIDAALALNIKYKHF